MHHLPLSKQDSPWQLSAGCSLGKLHILVLQPLDIRYKPCYTPEIDRWWRKPLPPGMTRVLWNKVMAMALHAAYGWKDFRSISWLRLPLVAAEDD